MPASSASAQPAQCHHKAPVPGGHLPCTREAQPWAALGPAVPSAKLLEFLQPEAMRSGGKALFTARSEGKDKESNRKGFKTLGPRRKM